MKAVVNKRHGNSLVYGLAIVPMPTVSGDKDLIVKMKASPINPSDLNSVGMVAKFGGENVAAGESPSTVATPLPEAAAGMFKADGATLPVGSEGMGVVVAAGASPEAHALIGKSVALCSGGTYAQYTKTTTDHPMFAVLPTLPGSMVRRLCS
jgi:NADPH:quinone reductase-like Zn-dependent oxidoreductase